MRARQGTVRFNEMLDDASLAQDANFVGASSIEAEDRLITEGQNEWKRDSKG